MVPLLLNYSPESQTQKIEFISWEVRNYEAVVALFLISRIIIILFLRLGRQFGNNYQHYEFLMGMTYSENEIEFRISGET